MKRFRHIFGIAFTSCALLSLAPGARAQDDPTPAPSAEDPAPASPELLDRGRLVFHAAGCFGCHSEAGIVLGGGAKFEGPFGTIYSANLTPDPQTGLGSWTDDEVTAAVRGGISRDGRKLSVIMPSHRYAGMSDEDAAALVAYLRTFPPVANAVPRSEPKDNPTLPYPAPTPAAATTGPDRGRYLVENVAVCAHCHTPAESNLAPVPNMEYAGGFLVPIPEPGHAPEAVVTPNITSDPETGIGKWSEDQLVHFLKTGQKPDGSGAYSLMRYHIHHDLRFLSDADLRAMASYVKSVPAINNTPSVPPPLKAIFWALGGGWMTIVAGLVAAVSLIVAVRSRRRAARA